MREAGRDVGGKGDVSSTERAAKFDGKASSRRLSGALSERTRA